MAVNISCQESCFSKSHHRISSICKTFQQPLNGPGEPLFRNAGLGAAPCRKKKTHQRFALRAQAFFTSDLTDSNFDFAPTLCHRKLLLARRHLPKKPLPIIAPLQRTVIAPLSLEEYCCTKIRTPVPLNRSTSYRNTSILQFGPQDEGYV